MTMVSLNGQVKATPTLTFSGVSYYRWFQQVHADANLTDAFECNVPPGPGTGTLCLNDPTFPDNQVLDGNGNPVTVSGGQVMGHDLDELGTLDHTSQNANSWGLSGQGCWAPPVLAHPSERAAVGRGLQIEPESHPSGTSSSDARS